MGVERLREHEKYASAKVIHKGTHFFGMVVVMVMVMVMVVKPTKKSGRCQVSLHWGEFAA